MRPVFVFGLPLLLLASCSPKPKATTWDFRHDYGIENVAPEKQWVGDSFGVDASNEPVDVDVYWPTGQHLHETVFYVVAERKGTQVSRVVIHFGSHSTIDEAYALARPIIVDWRFTAENVDRLDHWHAIVKTQTDARGTLELGGSSMGIRITPVRERPEGDDRVWSVMVGISTDGKFLPPPDSTKP